MKIKLLIKNHFVKHKKIYITFFCVIFILSLIFSMFFGKTNSNEKMMSLKEFTAFANSGSVKSAKMWTEMLIAETKDGQKIRVIFSLIDSVDVIKVLNKNHIALELVMKRK